MGKIVKRGVLERGKFENECCSQRPAMSQARLGDTRETGERTGLDSHTCSGRGAALAHHTRSLHPYTSLGDAATVLAL